MKNEYYPYLLVGGVSIVLIGLFVIPAYPITKRMSSSKAEDIVKQMLPIATFRLNGIGLNIDQSNQYSQLWKQLVSAGYYVEFKLMPNSNGQVSYELVYPDYAKSSTSSWYSGVN